jgi:hypothetical protein
VPPGQLPPETDPPLDIPKELPATTEHVTKQRFLQTPVYANLTTNVPDIAMSFSDKRFPYGPFPPHWVPRQCIQDYFTHCRTDSCLALNTTVEDMTRLPPATKNGPERWALTLRRYDPALHKDIWWREHFDAVIIANGHYAVPFIPFVPGLSEYIAQYPGKVFHSKRYRRPETFAGKRVLIIGNSASGYDIGRDLLKTIKLPLYQSRRSRNFLDPKDPPEGFVWKPIITQYDVETGDIVFKDGTKLKGTEIDYVIYCTGYNPSFPFWNSKANGGPIWNYQHRRIIDNYQHTFFSHHPTLGIIGIPRTLTFRSFEYQAIALARLFAGRTTLPDKAEMKRWYDHRIELVDREHRKFHDIPYGIKEVENYFRFFYDMAGLPDLLDVGKAPPVLDEETRWAIEHLFKYPRHDKDGDGEDSHMECDGDDDWCLVPDAAHRDILFFI